MSIQESTHTLWHPIPHDKEEVARLFLPDSPRSTFNLIALPLLPTVGALLVYSAVFDKPSGGFGGAMVVLFLSVLGMMAQFFISSQVGSAAAKISTNPWWLKAAHGVVAVLTMWVPYSLVFPGVVHALSAAVAAVMIEAVFLCWLFRRS